MSFLPIYSLLMNWIILTKVLFLGEEVVDAFWNGLTTTTTTTTQGTTTRSKISHSTYFLQRNTKSIPSGMLRHPKRIIVRNLVLQQQTTSSMSIPIQNNDDNTNIALPTRRNSNTNKNNSYLCYRVVTITPIIITNKLNTKN